MNDNDITQELLNSAMSGTLTYPVIDGSSILNIPTPLTTASIVGSHGAINNLVPVNPLDKYAMNRFAVDHKVTAAELLKLQEVAPDYAKEIKENIAKNLAREIATKVSYTKKHDKDTDVHHFIGRVWVFSEEELKEMLGVK